MNSARGPFFLLLSFAAAASTCRADGSVYRFDSAGGLALTAQDEQRAAIFWENGRERLVVTCQLKLDKAAQAVWIVPIPRDPSGCRVDILDRFPDFRGRTIRSEFKAEMRSAIALMSASQILPIPLLLAASSTLSAGPGGDRVAVHAVVDKFGLHCEAVSADSVEALVAHVAARGVKARAADFEPFRDYLGPEWSLVVTWISSAEEAQAHFGGRAPGISAEFATPRPFYPMKPTSRAYGKERGDPLGVRVFLWVNGLWDLDGPGAARDDLEIEYFHGGVRSADGGHDEDGSYTRIISTGHISRFTEDFYLTPRLPAGISARQAWLGLPGTIKVSGVLAFHLLYSLLVGVLANLIVLGRGKGAWWIGLCNVGTILGVWLAIRSVSADPNPAAPASRPSRPPPNPLFVVRVYVLTFMLLYTLPLLIPYAVL